MNITKNNNKSDYRIANSPLPLQKQKNKKNNNNNVHNNNNNNDTNINNYSPPDDLSRFAATQTSPSLGNFTNTISIASINVRGINDPTKFETILEDLTGRSLL